MRAEGSGQRPSGRGCGGRTRAHRLRASLVDVQLDLNESELGPEARLEGVPPHAVPDEVLGLERGDWYDGVQLTEVAHDHHLDSSPGAVVAQRGAQQLELRTGHHRDFVDHQHAQPGHALADAVVVHRREHLSRLHEVRVLLVVVVVVVIVPPLLLLQRGARLLAAHHVHGVGRQPQLARPDKAVEGLPSHVRRRERGRGDHRDGVGVSRPEAPARSGDHEACDVALAHAPAARHKHAAPLQRRGVSLQLPQLEAVPLREHAANGTGPLPVDAHQADQFVIVVENHCEHLRERVVVQGDLVARRFCTPRSVGIDHGERSPLGAKGSRANRRRTGRGAH